MPGDSCGADGVGCVGGVVALYAVGDAPMTAPESLCEARPVPNVGDSVWVWFCDNCGAAEGATMQAGCCRSCGVAESGTRLLLRVEAEAKP